MQVVDVDRILDRIQSELISLPDHLPAVNASSGKPHGKAIRVMVAARFLIRPAGLRHRGAAELATPDNQCAVEQPALLEILEQGRRRLVDGVAVLL